MALPQQGAHHGDAAAEQHQGAVVPAPLPAGGQVSGLRALRGDALAAECGACAPLPLLTRLSPDLDPVQHPALLIYNIARQCLI